MLMATSKETDEYYDRAETERRRETALKRMLATPHKPHKPIGKKNSKKKSASSKP
jgi:hypothetical protein